MRCGTDIRTLFSISEISKPCYFVLLARASAKDQSSGSLRQPLGREKIAHATHRRKGDDKRAGTGVGEINREREKECKMKQIRG